MNTEKAKHDWIKAARGKPLYGPHIMWIAVEVYADGNPIQVASENPDWFQPDADILGRRLMTLHELIDMKLDDSAWNFI